LDACLACLVKATVVGSRKVLALGEVLLLLFTLVTDALDDLLGIVKDAWVVSIGALDDVDPILKK
jgi:hypothetical protein